MSHFLSHLKVRAPVRSLVYHQCPILSRRKLRDQKRKAEKNRENNKLKIVTEEISKANKGNEYGHPLS